MCTPLPTFPCQQGNNYYFKTILINLLTGAKVAIIVLISNYFEDYLHNSRLLFIFAGKTGDQK
jgi:hypothetical protein